MLSSENCLKVRLSAASRPLPPSFAGLSGPASGPTADRSLGLSSPVLVVATASRSTSLRLVLMADVLRVRRRLLHGKPRSPTGPNELGESPPTAISIAPAATFSGVRHG